MNPLGMGKLKAAQKKDGYRIDTELSSLVMKPLPWSNSMIEKLPKKLSEKMDQQPLSYY